MSREEKNNPKLLSDVLSENARLQQENAQLLARLAQVKAPPKKTFFVPAHIAQQHRF